MEPSRSLCISVRNAVTTGAASTGDMTCSQSHCGTYFKAGTMLFDSRFRIWVVMHSRIETRAWRDKGELVASFRATQGGSVQENSAMGERSR